MINENNKHSWCVNAEHAMSGNNDGSTKICCMHNIPDNTERLTLGIDSISDIMRQKNWADIRKDLQNGTRNSQCEYCWQEEDSGRASKRVRDNERYFHEIKWGKRKSFKGLAKVELNLGNTCNISCRTCHPCISSGWLKEWYELNRKPHGQSFKDYANEMKKFSQTYDEDSTFWQDIETHLPTIKQFDFYGGEPFMIKKQWNLIKKASQLGYAKDIEIHYNTNGTHWPEEVEYWKDFKHINLSFSIDGIADQFEYMRYPANWELVEKNIQNAINLKNKFGNINLSWCITLSSANIYNLPETMDYYVENYSKDIGVYLNLVHNPSEHNISNLPKYLKESVIKKLSKVADKYTNFTNQMPGIINFIKNGNENLTHWSTFIKNTKIHDEYRKQDFSKTFPEWVSLIKEW